MTEVHAGTLVEAAKAATGEEFPALTAMFMGMAELSRMDYPERWAYLEANHVVCDGIHMANRDSTGKIVIVASSPHSPKALKMEASLKTAIGIRDHLNQLIEHAEANQPEESTE